MRHLRFFFFKQKTAYERRISDWSSDVCSSDLRLGRFRDRGLENQQTRAAALNLVTAAIILFNCRYLGHAVEEMRLEQRGIERHRMVEQIGRASCRERVCQYV